MRAGFAFIFADRPDVEHLWFVVVVKDGTAVIANFTSWRLGYDESCVVEAGEHPFLRKRSIVLYSAARVVPICNLEAALKKKGCREFGHPLSAELLLKIQRGAISSPQTPLKARSLVETLFSDR